MGAHFHQIDHIFVNQIINLGSILGPLPLCCYDLLVEFLLIFFHVSVYRGIFIRPVARTPRRHVVLRLLLPPLSPGLIPDALAVIITVITPLLLVDHLMHPDTTNHLFEHLILVSPVGPVRQNREDLRDLLHGLHLAWPAIPRVRIILPKLQLRQYLKFDHSDGIFLLLDVDTWGEGTTQDVRGVVRPRLHDHVEHVARQVRLLYRTFHHDDYTQY